MEKRAVVQKVQSARAKTSASLALKEVFDSAIRGQEARIRQGLEKANARGNADADKGSNQQSRVKFKLKVHMPGTSPEKSGIQFEGKSRDIELAVAIAFWFSAVNSHNKALAAFLAGRYEVAMSEFAASERSIGAANSLSCNSQIASTRAKLRATDSHIDTRAMEKKVIEYWREQIPPSLSAPKAADLMLGLSKFRWKNGDDVSHKFLAECVRKVRKAAHSTK